MEETTKATTTTNGLEFRSIHLSRVFVFAVDSSALQCLVNAKTSATYTKQLQSIAKLLALLIVFGSGFSL